MKNKQTRKQEASIRTEEYKTLSTSQKLMKLDLKLGGGKGAAKQRKRLTMKLEEERSHAQTGTIPSGVGDSINKKKAPYQKPKRS